MINNILKILFLMLFFCINSYVYAEEIDDSFSNRLENTSWDLSFKTWFFSSWFNYDETDRELLSKVEYKEKIWFISSNFNYDETDRKLISKMVFNVKPWYIWSKFNYNETDRDLLNKAVYNIKVGFYWSNYWKVIEEEDQNEINFSIIKLNQEILSPHMQDRENVEIWEKIWKFQSWTWLILSAEVSNPNSEKLKLIIQVSKIWLDSFSKEYSNHWYLVDNNIEVIIPYNWTWSYVWKAKLENIDWISNDWIDFWSNDITEVDYELYEWFEPYPYGYNFHNRGVASSILSWWIDYLWTSTKDYYSYKIRKKVDWTKWDIFSKTFDLSGFDNNDSKLLSAFESLWLNSSWALQDWNCFGMAVSSALQQSNSSFFKDNFLWFSQKIWSWFIWDNIEEPNIWYVNSRYKWNEYNDITELILSTQLSQYSSNYMDLKNKSITKVTDIVNQLEENPNETYLINIYWTNQSWKKVWHSVIPYKIEKEKDLVKIYIWDNNYQYPYRTIEGYGDIIANNLYITLDWDSFYTNYNRKTFDKIQLISLDDIFNWWKLSTPRWFTWEETNYSLSWSADIYLTDEYWNISWFKDGNIYEEIEWVNVIIPLNDTLDWENIENKFKEIYLKERQDLTLNIKWLNNELYDLLK